MAFRLLWFFVISLFGVQVLASFPEFEHITDNEQGEINSPRLIDGEYESDRLAYQFLSTWHEEWLTHQNIFQYGAGSLGPTRFFTRGRFRFEKELSEVFTFRLSYAELGDARITRQALIFEFQARLNEWFSLSLYGQPATLKKEDDIGLAAIFDFDKNQIRVFYTAVNFSHNKRTEDGSEYTEQPSSFGAVWRYADSESGDFVEASFRQDTSTELRFNNGRVYQFGATVARWLSQHSLDEVNNHFIGTEFNYSKGYEGDTQNTDFGIERWEHINVDGMVQWIQKASWLKTLGLRFVYSGWRSGAGNVIHNDILPHSWFNVYRSQVGSYLHDIDLGYEFTWHRGQGDSFLRSDLDTDNKLEHRFNARYALNINNETSFYVLLTFDLDRFGTGETWEGGAMQFSTTF
jgi:hypothetical protein